jgi:pyrroline-5-carboxylate reductase
VLSLATETDPEANRLAVSGARLVVLGVKPAMILDLLRDVAPALDPAAIVVSVAGGITTASMEAVVPNPVVRAMPNTPSTVRRGVTGVSAGSRASAEQVEMVSTLFSTVGRVIELPEAEIDALSTISGSGPAYVFLVMEKLTETAMRHGFDESAARTMVEQTFLGAAELLEASNERPAELRRRVTSPKGTTERAIAVLEQADLSELFDRATAAALARARELAAT